MHTFIATINPTGADKLRDHGAYVRLHGNVLRFFEDDEKSARVFYRRYVRNFTGVVLGEADYSLYAEPVPDQGDRRPLGLRENPDCRELARPGLAGVATAKETVL